MNDESRNPYHRANSLIELLSWHDVAFVRCAYVTVLGRQPDADGEAYYTYRLRQGVSKLEILWHLRKSPEGPSHDPGITGFDRALKKARWEQSFLGPLVRVFTRGEGNAAQWRQRRVLINEVGRINDWQQRSSKSPELAGQLRAIAAQIGALTETISRMSPGAATSENSTPSHLQYLESPDYRHLSASGQNIFRRVHAHSH